MRKSIPGIVTFILVLIFILNLYNTALAQTPTTGLIYKPATNGGNKVLDPNGDGYVSRTTSGFPGVNMDEGATYSEIPYRPFPVFMNEPLSDLSGGAKGGHTDYALNVYDGNGNLVGSPMASYYDGTNFMFRVRLGGQSTASKGYSILIDINNTLTGSAPNPGFEFEVVLATNFDVKVYDHRTNTTGTAVIFNGSADQYSQKSIASSLGGGDADYFYDFYVPMSAFNGGITSSTSLRMTGLSVTSAKSGLFGVISDISGIDDTKYQGNTIGALRDIINSTPTSTPTGIQGSGFTQAKAKAPYVNGPIVKGGTTVTISGYSAEAAGSQITVYQNGTSIGQTTVLADGTWSLVVNNTVLIADQLITATVKPTNKTISDLSNAVRVQQSACFTTPPPTITGITSGNKGLTGSTSVTGLIKIYAVGSPTVLFSGTISAGTTWIAEWGNSGGSIPSGTYYATVTVDGCESQSSNQLCFLAATQGNGQSTVITTAAPSISPSSITAQSATLTITGPIGSTLTLNKNGVQIATATLGTSPNTTSTVWTVTVTGLVNGDVLFARATSGTSCPATSGRSNAATVTIASTPVQSTAPVITGNYCGSTSAITGTSSEAPGTVIKLLRNGVQIATTTVNAFGGWSITGLTLTGGNIMTATATAPYKTESTASAPVTIGSAYAGVVPTITTSPVIEGATSLRGTAASGAIITLYINGDPYVIASGSNAGNTITATTNSSGIWEFTSISPFEFYAGANLTVTAKTSLSSTCEGTASAAVTVQCKAANSDMTASFSSSSHVTTITACPGTAANVYLSTSEAGTIYNIYKKETNGTYTQFGSSVLGTGNRLTLTSSSVTVSGTILQVRTIKVGATCQYNIGSELVVNHYPPVPNNFTLAATNTSACPGVASIISVNSAQAGYSYQLIINNAAKTKVGDPVIPTTTSNISFPALTVHTTTIYSVIITRLDGGCIAENVNNNTITITRSGAIVDQVVTSSASTVCVGGSATFSFTRESANYIYSLTHPDGSNVTASNVTVTGNQVSIQTGPLNNAGVNNFKIRVQRSGGCDTYLIEEPKVNVTNSPAVAVSAGSNQTVCGSTVTLNGSNPAPGTGLWTKVSGTGGTITTPGAASTTVTDLTSGTYVFRWTVTTSCGSGTSSSADVTIRVNCAATYVVGTTKFYDEYVAGDVLATFSDDSDGGIVSFVAVNGIRPQGSNFVIENGKLVLKVTTAPLMGGDYYFTMRTTDARGVTTDSPIMIRMYDRSQAPVGVTPLPVELKYLRATAGSKQVLLNWETASEKNNDRFEVQRSADGKTFNTIGTVAGNGTSSQAIRYSFTDTTPLSGVSYYRLRQVDFDTKATISSIVSVKLIPTQEAELSNIQAYPNPFTDEFTLELYTQTEGSASLSVVDMQGRKVLTRSLQLTTGTNTYRLSLPQSGRGMYIIKVTGSEVNTSLKLAKVE